MLKIELDRIITKAGLSQEEAADMLFPSIKHPKLALRRVLKGEGNLDSEQLSRLASALGCSVSELYSGGDWSSESTKKLHVFKNGDYRAELDPETWKTTIYHNDSLFFEDVIHSGMIPLSQYLKELDLIIKTNT
jgi:transcriptional regulator with XRE-family HTH domain